MEVKILEPEKEQAVIADLAQEMTKVENAVLIKHGLKIEECILLLKSYALAQSVKYAIICGVSKANMLLEDGIVYDLMAKQFEAAGFKTKAEGETPSA